MNDKPAGRQPVEKWIDRVRFVSGESEVIEDQEGGKFGALPDPSHAQALDKTPEEKAAVAETIAGINIFRDVICGLPPLAFPEARLHVLTEQEFRTKVAPTRFQGRASLGHVYLWRGWPLWEFMALLAHEMVHAVSYLWLDLRDGPVTTSSGLKLAQVIARRQGMALVDPSFGTLLPHFHGLNEGATEMAAIIIRRLVADRTRLLDDADRNNLREFVSSYPLIAFTERLLEEARGPQGDHVATSAKLFRDLMSGTDGFLAALEANLPGATEVLRATGQTPKELLASANRLGFAKEAEFIAKFCE